MLSINNKVNKMDTEKLRKLEIITKRSVSAGFVIIIVLLVAVALTAAFHVAEDKAFVICGIGFIFSLGAWCFLCEKYSMIYHELVKRKISDSLSETEKQVKIKAGYHGFTAIFLCKSLLEGATTTARFNKETGKVILRCEMLDDEGKPFSITREFEKDKIIYDLEIL